MIVLKLHKISLYIFISGLIFTIILPVLFSSLFFPLFAASLFLLYTPTSPCLSGNLLYFSIYISLVSVATIYFPVLFFFEFPYCGCNLFLPHLILVFYCVALFVTVTLFADDTQVIFIYISVTYDMFFFSKHLLRPFPDIFSYGIHLMKIIYVKLNSKRIFLIPVYIGYFPCSFNLFCI